MALLGNGPAVGARLLSFQIRVVPRPGLKHAALPLAAAILLLGASVAAGASDQSRKVLPGSAFRQIAQARVVGHVDGRQQLDVFVALKPRNADLLAELATHSSGRKPLDSKRMKALFLPTKQDVAAVRAYLSGYGLRFRSAKGLTLSFAGNASGAERAFGVQLSVYRDARGHSFRAPNGPLRLPPALAARVAAVDGLDTVARYRSSASVAPHAVTPAAGCGAPTYQSSQGGYLPAEFAGPDGYNFQPLLDAGADGDNEAVAFVEYSYYLSSNVTKFKDCFGLTTPITNVYVGDRNFDLKNQPEVILDLDVTMGAAPGLDAAYVYIAKDTVSMATMLNQIVAEQSTTNVHIISISWGLCEQLLPPSELSAVNSALQLAAVSGMSVFSASGDFGSSDCYPYLSGAAVDDPSSQPYATALGGTTLDVSVPKPNEVVWNGGPDGGSGGGGLSMLWMMPSWQSAAGIIGPESSGAPCASSGGYCRHVPDVALDADPQTGYIVYCTWPSSVCTGWVKVGGTSAGAPLLAGITADANEYSLANGGERLGFASPFLYDRFASGSSMFFDVDTGSNDILSLGKFSAAPGYDMATGLGTLDGYQLAQDLAAYTPASTPAAGHTTLLTASPTTNKTITYGSSVTFSGQLKDTTTGSPVQGAVVWVELDYGTGGGQAFRAVTNGTGHWTMTLRGALREKLVWRAFYLGGEGLMPDESASHLILVRPKLYATSSARMVNGHYVVRHGVLFYFNGRSGPNLAGQSVYLEWRPTSSSRWRLGAYGRFDATGRISVRGSFSGPGRFYMRWRYPGSTSKPWMPATSRSKLFVVS
jgi:subtilase family serine protease